MDLTHGIICRRSCLNKCWMSLRLNYTGFALLGGGNAYIGLESIEAFGEEGACTIKCNGAECFRFRIDGILIILP